MLDNWYRTLHVPMSLDQFHQLPRNPAYKYEYIDGQAWLSPRPKTFTALLDVAPRPVEPLTSRGRPIEVRPIADADWPRFPKLFAAAFELVPPFAALSDDERLQASTECVAQTRRGGDGPLIGRASFAAVDPTDDRLLAAILITLIPKRDEGDSWDGEWPEPPATESAQLLLGRPHLTWIFVPPHWARRGLGSGLLDRSVNALHEMGFADLGSTFLLGNESTMLWHWRNGFRILPNQWSLRGH